MAGSLGSDKRGAWLRLAGVLLAGLLRSQVVSASEPLLPVHVVAVGDLGFRRQVGIDIAAGSGQPLAAVQKQLAADLSFANLETVLSRRALPDPVAARRFPIVQGPPQGAQYLARSGFDVVSVANNHAFDFYAAGFLDTLRALDEAGVRAIGGGRTPEQALRPFVQTIRGVRIGMLALASGVNRAPHGPAAVAWVWHPASLAAIRALRPQVDVLLVSVHWGIEGVFVASDKQRQRAHALIQAGADVILGHHPHVLQSVEVFQQRLIVYSLGNFLFGKQPLPRRQTVILHLRFAGGPQPIVDVRFDPVLINPQTEQPAPATGEAAAAIRRRLRDISQRFNLRWTEQGDSLILGGPWTTPAATATAPDEDPRRAPAQPG